MEISLSQAIRGTEGNVKPFILSRENGQAHQVEAVSTTYGGIKMFDLETGNTVFECADFSPVVSFDGEVYTIYSPETDQKISVDVQNWS